MAKTQKKKKDPGQSRDFMLDNALVKSLPDEYVKNPLSFSQICGDFSLSQTNLMIAMVSQMQDRINELLKAPTDQMLLFSQEEMLNDDLEVQIPLNQLGVIPQRYGELDAALEALHSMKITYEERDENGIVYKVRNNVVGKSKIPVEEVTSDGTKISYKGGHRRKGCVTISIRKDCVKDLFNLKKGYTEHLKGIVKLCKRARTPRLYIYLSSWRKQGMFVSDFNDLKEFLGVLTYNRERTKVVENKYTKFADFKRYVLDPVEEEMKNLASQNKIEFFFTYEPIYKGSRTTGNPEKIRFVLHNTQKGIDFDLNKRIERLHSALIKNFGLHQTEWEKFSFALDAESEKKISSQLFKYSEAIQKNNVAVPHSYVTSCIMSELGIEEVEEAEIVAETPEDLELVLTDADFRLWDKFVDVAPTMIDDSFAQIYVTPCKLHKNTKEECVILVPTNFVKEMWIKQGPKVGAALKSVFGEKKFNLMVDPDYV